MSEDLFVVREPKMDMFRLSETDSPIDTSRSDTSFAISYSDEPVEALRKTSSSEVPKAGASDSEFDISDSDEIVEETERTIPLSVPRPFRVAAKAGARAKPEFDILGDDEPDENCARTLTPEPDLVVENIVLQFRKAGKEEEEEEEEEIPQSAPRNMFVEVARQIDFFVKLGSLVFLTALSLRLFVA